MIEVGSDVTSFSVGDRVLVPASTGCDTCARCSSGRVDECLRGLSGCYGLGAALPGSQCEVLAVPFAERNLEHLPEGIANDAALVLTDNLPTAWFGTRRAEITPGCDVAVVGLGPVGLCAVQAAIVLGAARVFAVDLVPSRRAAAVSMGGIDTGDDAKAMIDEMTGGVGVHSVIEAAGADASIRLTVDVVRRNGTVSVVGVTRNNAFEWPMARTMVKNLTFRIGLCPVQNQLPELLPLVAAGRLRPELVVSHHLGLSEGPEAYRRFHAREDGVLKISLDPTR